MATTVSAGSMQELIMKGDKNKFMVGDDNFMMRQIQATHAPDGREVDVKPLLLLVEDILPSATPSVSSIVPASQKEDKTNQASTISMIDALSYVIDRISSEILLKSSYGGDWHTTTVSLLNMLSTYSWDAKLVLTLAAFALHYGEFWLLAQQYSSNRLARSMAILKQYLSVIIELAGPLKPRSDALDNLTKAMLDVSRCIVEFKELPPLYITQDLPAFSAAMSIIPTAVYWTVRSVVACATQITSFTSMGLNWHGISTTEAWELSALAHKLKNRSDHLKKQLALCYEHIDCQELLKLFEINHSDNMKILKALIYVKDDLQPLLDGSTKKRVNIDVLRSKNVLLLISGLDISSEEILIHELIYNERRLYSKMENQYEIVWIPIMDRSVQWTDSMQKQFERLQSAMSWYTVHHPMLIDRAVVKLIKEKWQFKNRPILVVLDPQARVLSPNASHMMWIWGSNAFPFTSFREKDLWNEETWGLELLVNGIDPAILTWIREGKYILLYGGDSIERIRKFTRTTRDVAKAAGISLEMVYVGKSSKTEQFHKIIAAITEEKLGYFWEDIWRWFFWTRLESMLFSKANLEGRANNQDPITKEIKKLVSYNEAGGWGVLSKGSRVLINGHGSTVLPTLLEYDLWKEHVPTMGFDTAIKDHHDKVHSVIYPYCRYEIPSTTEKIPENVKCPDCLLPMEKSTTFRCCHDENGLNALY